MGDFSRYVDGITRETGWERERLWPCRVEICSAIYGTGNPDISGIGVAIGYVLMAGLSLSLSALTVLLVRRHRTHPKRLSVVTAGLQSFFDAAAYFAIAAQLATIIFLSMKDFGISTSNFETIEAQIAQIVSVVCMLPLLYPIVLLDATDEPAKHNMRVFLLNVAASLSFYTFVSRCIHWFSNTPMRTSDGDVIDMDDWGEVEGICFSDGLLGLEKNRVYGSIGALGISSMILVYIFTFWQNLGLLGFRHLAGRSRWQDLIFQHYVWRECLSRHPYYATVFLLVPVGLSLPLLWAVFYLRHLQRELSHVLSMEYEGDSWGFGQIVSIVIFAPVPISMAYHARFG
ncbi:uncharacterized protein J7T54_001509 [Emericellopsis cladophorae]|uniref:Uncharacterized protein n=1 Tax=Emericellopsis cladophorae TaxID=2686198 RepID=A0A9P9Y1E9_9HYPO|nr:uncharacterized protein J7T54_001509 [Emericellopsis cladophorae]KAI6781546.1 hypothetical protein J7T54_001509 [Emericellopsis cladophorae]